MHNDRMKNIGKWAVPPEGTIDREILDQQFSKIDRDNPQFNKKIKKIHDESISYTTVQNENGAGFPADKLIREYLFEYNNRATNATLSDMPSSFNVAEAFGSFSPPPFIFKVNKEKDFIFSFTDFLDFVTSDDAPSDFKSIDHIMDEGVAYSFNSVDDPLDNIFSTSEEIEFGLLSVSLIRHSNEVSILMLGGQVSDLKEETKKLIETHNTYSTHSRKKNIIPDESLDIEAIPLIDGKDLWRTIVLVRLDIETSTIDARYVFQDAGRSYQGVTDDINTFLDHTGNFANKEIEELFNKNKKNVDTYNPLFELCKTAVLLPYFSEEFEDAITVERHPTQCYENIRKAKYRKINQLVDRSFKVTFRDVKKISPSNKRQPVFREFTTPNLQIETSGYWKKLDFQSSGRDKNNQPIQGRTWVNKTLTWQETNAVVNTNSLRVRRKNCLSLKDSGYIYVMRSAAHEKDILKLV